MNCKFCNAELDEGVTLCPECGKDNLEEIVEETIADETIAEEQNDTAEEPPEEAAGEETEEVPTKKTALWVKILAVIGALALVVVLVGAVLYGVNQAGKQMESYTVSDQKAIDARDTVVATVGDLELTNSELQVYYWQAANDFYSTYGYYLDASTLDFEKPLDEQFYDEENGVTWQQYFLESGLSAWSRYAALYMQAKEDGFELSAEMQEYFDTIPDQLEEMAATYGYDSAEAMLNADMGMACDTDGYMAYMHTNMFAGQYLDSIYDSLVPTMEEIEAYYKENEATLNEQGITDDGSITVDARHILICPQGGTEDADGNVTYSDEEWETCRAKAQEILDKWLAEDGTEDGFAALAAEHTEDPGSMSTGGLYTDIYEGQMVAPFEDWCFDESRKYGDTGLVQTTYGYHIMYFVESREVWISNVSDTMIYESSMQIVNDAVAKWPMEVNYKKIVMGEVTAETAE